MKHHFSVAVSGPYLALLLVLATAPRPVSGQTTDATRYDEAIARAQRLAREISVTSGVPGMSFAVGVDGNIIWQEGFGLSDLEQGLPATELTRYRVGSVAKSFTAAAVGKLIEERRLDLDEEVQTYVPYFPKKRWPITTRQVAGHLAGIRHYLDEEFLLDEHFDSVQEGLTIFQDDTLLFEPGTSWSYSSYGYNLVSAVVEGASGRDFLSFMRSDVLDPRGMPETVADQNDEIIPHRTRFYQRTDDGWANAPHVDNSYKWAGGGYLSTVGDMARFGMSLQRHELLKPETVELLWTKQTKTNGDSTDYGIGFFISKDFDGRRVAGHGGGSIGGNAELMIFRDQGLVLTSAANAEAPIHYNELWAMAVPFFDDGVDRVWMVPDGYLGTLDCRRATHDGEKDVALHIVESSGPMIGWATMDDAQHHRIIDAWSEDDDLRLVAIASSGWIGNIRLSQTADGFNGTWNRDALQCTKTGP